MQRNPPAGRVNFSVTPVRNVKHTSQTLEVIKEGYRDCFAR